MNLEAMTDEEIEQLRLSAHCLLRARQEASVIVCLTETTWVPFHGNVMVLQNGTLPNRYFWAYSKQTLMSFWRNDGYWSRSEEMAIAACDGEQVPLMEFLVPCMSELTVRELED